MDNQLESWLQQGGARFPKVTIGTKAGRRGLFAIDDIEPNEVVAHIPLSICLFCDQSEFQMEAKLFDQQSEWWRSELVLIKKLMGELANPHSLWRDYLDAITKSTLFTYQDFDDAAFSLLKSSAAWFDLAVHIVEYHHDAALMERVTRGTSPSEGRAKRLFEQAYGLFQSRHCRAMTFGCQEGFGCHETDHCFIPLIDMCNHAEDQTLTITFSSAQQAFIVTATSPIAAGDELFVRYGVYSNVELFLRYGFTQYQHPIKSALLPLNYYLKAEKSHLTQNSPESLEPILINNVDYDLFNYMVVHLRAHIYHLSPEEVKMDLSLELEKEITLYEAIIDICDMRIREIPYLSEEEFKQAEAKIKSSRQMAYQTLYHLILDEHEVLKELKRSAHQSIQHLMKASTKSSPQASLQVGQVQQPVSHTDSAEVIYLTDKINPSNDAMTILNRHFMKR